MAEAVVRRAAPTLQIPDPLLQSYENFKTYPRNLLWHSTYPAALEGYASRLAENAARLFVDDDLNIHVPFRDFEGKNWVKRNVLSDEKLKELLWDRSTIDAQISNSAGEVVTKKDPLCRFVFMWAGNSRAPLRITRNMFLRILTYHQVMPNYLDFIFPFGQQIEQRDLRFSGFREQTSFTSSSHALEARSLGWSSRQFQLCYNLKAVPCLSHANTEAQHRLWSIRQAAICHKFDVETGTTLWVITNDDLDLKDRIQGMTGVHGRPEDRTFSTPEQCFKSSLAVHLLLSHWSTEGWRWYIQWLEEMLRDTTQHPITPILPMDFQSVQYYADKAVEAIMVLEANNDVLISLRKFYERVVESHNFPLRGIGREDIVVFSTRIDEMIHDSIMQIARAKLLTRMTESANQLFLYRLKVQAAETSARMEEGWNLYTERMHNISTKSLKEASSVRIITIITLIYLPSSFLSALLSTDITAYKAPNRSMQFNSFLSLTIPLIILTAAVWACFFLRKKNEESKHFLPITTTDFMREKMSRVAAWRREAGISDI